MNNEIVVIGPGTEGKGSFFLISMNEGEASDKFGARPITTSGLPPGSASYSQPT